MTEAAQILDHLLQRAIVSPHTRIAILLTPALRFFTHEGQQLILARQRQVETCRQPLDFGWQLEGMRDQHQRRLVELLSQGNILEQAHQ